MISLFLENSRRTSLAFRCFDAVVKRTLKDFIKHENIKRLRKIKSVLRYIQQQRQHGGRIIETVMLYMRSFMELCRRLKEVYRTFSGLSFSCESKVETPYTKCLKGFNRVYGDCMRVKILSGVCGIIITVRNIICPILNLAMDILCSFPKFIKNAIKEIGKGLLGDLLETLKRDLHVKVEVESSFNHTINVSVTKAGYSDLVLESLF
ncbi:hypothetical protein Pcinc_015415 [Petrolisthes cinctipes]|uniref:Uncharacterized protein n=1 Tax=Petrolisthes cinctipes TaxID=88211 RepID=A0AAE1FUJ1_PETCI|nr:hypothetical protein Pcinc_015415 [Petrolisthes cinctipes]